MRVVLALLVLRAGQLVSRDALVDALWPDDPPPSARQTVESYVSRLRRALREAGLDGAIIESASAGYRLELNGYGLDRDGFEALVTVGREARAAGDTAAAAAHLGEGLSLWRGPALEGLAELPALRADVAALTQARLLALEEWAQVQLDLGLVAEVLAVLRPETARHPRHERVHELLMLALYRSGAQADALEHYAAVRRDLVDELGLEPGRGLRELQQRILRQDPALDPAPEAPPAEPVSRGAPARRGRASVAAAGFAIVACAAAALLLTRDDDGPSVVAALGGAPAVVALDAENGEVRTAAALPAPAGRIATGLGARWATTPDDGTLLRLDRGGRVTQTVRVGSGPVGVVTAAGDVWVATAREDEVVRVDAETSRVVQRIPVGASPVELAAADNVVWVADSREPTVTRVDARTGRRLGTTTLRGPPGGLASGYGSVWVSIPSVGRVARLDPRSGRVREEIAVGSGAGPIIAGAGGVWVANTLDSTVSLIDPDRASVLLTQQVRGTASAITKVGMHVWVAAGDTPALTRLARGEPARVTRLPSPATALTADGGRLLAALQADGRSHRGGTLRVRMAFEFDEPDTHLCCSTPPALRNASYDGLLGISVAPGATGSLVPNLALAVPRPQDDGRTYTFHLRPGLRYWTGRYVRAADFRRGIELAALADPYMVGYLEALPGSGGCARRGGRCDLRAAVITDDEAGTVTLHLAHPDPELLWALALSNFAPSPTREGPVPGTGPYRIARVVPNRLVDLRRNRYFRERAPAAQPDGYPDRILWQLGAEATKSVADVLAGRADYTTDPATSRQFDDLRVRTPRQLHIQLVAGNEYAWLNTRARPFDDVRVRRALALAVDRGALARGWPGSRPLCQNVPASIPGHVPYCPFTRHPNEAGGWNGPDLAKARALITASHTTDVPITYHAVPGVTAGPSPLDTYMASLLRRLGYRVKLVTGKPRGVVQIGTGSWWADIPSASQWIRQLGCGAGSANPARFCDPAVDRLTRRAGRLQSSDPAAANRLWARADRLLTDQAPWVPTIQPSWVDITSPRVGGWQYVPAVGVLPHRLWVR